MLLTITEDDLIENIQSEFHRQYPLLSLHFFKNPHNDGVAAPETERLPACTPIDDIRMFHAAGVIDISRERNVRALEHEFFTRFGLSVQVNYQSGNVLPETVNPALVSLDLLSRKASEIASVYEAEKAED